MKDVPFLTGVETRILMALARKGGLSWSRIVAETGLSVGTTGNTCRRLVRNGVLVAEGATTGDTRRVFYKPTPWGWTLFRAKEKYLEALTTGAPAP